jgi:hypothetical protein
MPGPHQLDATTALLVKRQRGLLTVAQALGGGLTDRSLRTRKCREGWQMLLPGVLLTSRAPATWETRVLAAQLWAGPASLVDGRTAASVFGLLDRPAADSVVQVVLPATTSLRSTGFVQVRRTRARLASCGSDTLRGVELVRPAHAVLHAASQMSQADATALIARAVQRRLVSVGSLREALLEDRPHRLGHLSFALEAVQGGVRSEGEARFRKLARASRLLPALAYNWLLALPGGRRVSPDALCESAALIHETNGWSVHAASPDDFDSTEERRDACVVAGFTVLSNSPRQIRDQGERVIAEFEQVYLRDAGKGLPPGVRVLRRAA